ncbi:MAG: thioredoxin family protein [Alphaproteobacteria bacterium]|jgi:thiol-disulfide isomerase/thioredoxin|nr:thioredoxin family protein [Alphaproteobacteria bacterium]
MQENGLVVVVKRDCPTCVLVAPVIQQLLEQADLTVYSQDDPNFPDGMDGVADDTTLDASYGLDIEIVPTLVRFENGREVERTYGWDRAAWEHLTGRDDLGTDLPAFKPGCGALNQEQDRLAELRIRHGDTPMVSRLVPLGAKEDAIEACFERGWSDGLPVVPPTQERVLAMLEGTTRAADEVLGLMPSNLDTCTVEKVAINAVMAGCKPEYMPVVLAAIEAVLEEDYCLHGTLATTRFVGPVVIVNGPIAQQIGMNGKGNALGQGNRANATIGRAVQLAVRNIGGGKPQGVDRATLGNPGKLTYCFCEDEEGSAWEPLVVDRGLAAGTNAVTVFAGFGLQGVIDDKARSPEELVETFATSLRAVDNVNKFPGPDCILVVCPEHENTLMEGGWDKARLHKELMDRMVVPAESVMRGTHGMAEGVSTKLAGKTVSKLVPTGLLIVRAGGGAGKFSGIIAGWTPGTPESSRPVTKIIKT